MGRAWDDRCVDVRLLLSRNLFLGLPRATGQRSLPAIPLQIAQALCRTEQDEYRKWP